jgi:hypothetical protein
VDGEEYLALAVGGIVALMLALAVAYAVHWIPSCQHNRFWFVPKGKDFPLSGKSFPFTERSVAGIPTAAWLNFSRAKPLPTMDTLGLTDPTPRRPLRSLAVKNRKHPAFTRVADQFWPMAKIPSYTGTDSENPERPEIEHYGNCPDCGALVDMRDLVQVMAHMHGEVPLVLADPDA